MKVLVALLLLCSTADAGKWEVRAHKQRNRQYENECGITAKKWDTRFKRAQFRLSVANKFSIWGWLMP